MSNGAKEAYDAEKKRREQAIEMEAKAQKAFATILSGLELFFSGKASLLIGSLEVSFKRDDDTAG